VSVEFGREALTEHIRSRERRGVLDGRQQLCEVEMGCRLDNRSLERGAIVPLLACPPG